MYLVEKLPKAGAEATEEVMGSSKCPVFCVSGIKLDTTIFVDLTTLNFATGGSEMLQRSIAHEITRRLKSPWTPPYCKTKGIAWRSSPAQWQREVRFVQTAYVWRIFSASQLRVPLLSGGQFCSWVPC